MGTDRGERLLSHPDQWARCAHQGTALLAGGGVELNWSDEPDPACRFEATVEPRASGLAFDRWCRAYRSRRAAVEVYPVREPPRPAPCPGVLQGPLGLAVDRSQRLYVVESAAHAVLVVDLWTGRLLRRIRLGRIRPRDVSADCGRVWLLAGEPACLLILDGRRGPRPGPAVRTPRCAGRLRASRVAAGSPLPGGRGTAGPPLPGDRGAAGPLLLWTGSGAGIVAAPDGTVLLEVAGATDLAMVDGVLAVARQPGQSIRRFQPDGGTWTELDPVGAPDYDGGAIAASQGRIGYTTEAGYRTTIGPVSRHLDSGSVTSYRLDSGRYRNRWGRLFLDACLPLDTAVGVRFLTSDSDEVEDPIPAQPAGRGGRLVPHPESTPPLPSATLLEAAGPPTVLFRRPTGPEQSWAVPADSAQRDSATYEAPVAAPPGRYLWVQLLLTGAERATPRVRALRVESIDHGLLSTLPRAWSRSEPDAQFLHRFLTPIDGVLYDLDWRAAQRAILLDPRVSPAEALDWLASFAGLVLDARWPEDARRTLVAEAYQLFARRGTKAALIRILEIFLGRPPQIVEQWQLRGLGGTVLGGPLGTPAPAIGSGQQTGTLGRFTLGGAVAGNDSYRLSAHRFTVLVPGTLTAEQRTVVAGILDVHRPAHTAYEICELGCGMRVGERLRVALTSFVGPSAGWQRAVVGSTGVGTDGVLGTPAIGSRLGSDSVTGRVRVG
jgi:phage tail-like protein